MCVWDGVCVCVGGGMVCVWAMVCVCLLLLSITNIPPPYVCERKQQAARQKPKKERERRKR